MFKKDKDFLCNRMFFMFGLLVVVNIIMLITFLALSKSYLISVLFFIMLVVILYAFYKFVWLAYCETKKVLQLFIKDYTVQSIFQIRYPYTKELKESFEKFKELLKTEQLVNATKKQSQYLALQNQINPHFLYNTLEGIRSDAIVSGLFSVAEMTKALATFFRYTISNLDKLVPLNSEITNIKNYFFIQKYRFEERINLEIVCDSDYEKAMSYLVPKLILQPIVENAIIHGIEQKIGNGTIKIRIEVTLNHIIITISDDGVGIAYDRLIELDERLNKMSLEYINQDGDKQGGIAIINVNNRIKLLFGEEYGIHIYSTQGLGTDVEVNMPLITEDVSL